MFDLSRAKGTYAGSLGAVDPQHDYMAEYQDENNPIIFNYRRMISWNDCPHLQVWDKFVERKSLERKYGRNSAYVKSMLYGEFQRGEDFSLIYTDEDIELIKKAMRGDNRGKTVGSDRQAACDVSGGGDAQILMIRVGTEIIFQDKHQCENEIAQAEYWVNLLNEIGIKPWELIVDGGGLGATVANYMEQRLGFMGIQRAQANTGPKFKFEFRDKYTEVHFMLKEILSAGVVHFSRYDEELLKQIRHRRFVEMELGEKIKTEPKPMHRKREKSSPDELDTLVYLFYNFDPSHIAHYRADDKEGVTAGDGGLSEFEKEAAEKVSAGRSLFKGMRDMTVERREFRVGMREYISRIEK